MPVAPRGSTALGINLRTPQVVGFQLDMRSTLAELLQYPFRLIRLGAYWNRIETAAGVFDTGELDAQLDAAETAGKQVVLCVGALKVFGYPEFFVPAHRLPRPLPEHTRIRASAFTDMLQAATEFIARVVERYRQRPAIVAWQVEHESVDPLGFEHSWRLDLDFVRSEVEAVRRADPSRAVLLNGYLPTSLLVRLTQWWLTRDQGDSLVAAQALADIVGIDYYPRNALVGVGDSSLYVDGGSGGGRRRLFGILEWARHTGHRVMLTEGQAEPWEAVTRPPNPRGEAMWSCTPEQVVANYNTVMSWAALAAFELDAYLFWGAEYWLVRKQSGDPSYLRAFARILEQPP
jgi:Beta-galactosidase